MNKRLIVTDTQNSALAIAASNWARILGAELIYSSNFRTRSELVRFLVTSEPEWVLFSWRGGLSQILLSKKLTNKLSRGRPKTKYWFSVADHASIETPMQAREKRLINFCDGFTVVSKKLYDEYNIYFAPNTPTYIMHDLPNIDLLKKIAKLNRKRENTVIWIGNSKWGNRQGFIDHKGYERFLKPIMTRVSEIDNSIKFVIIDRAVKTYPQDEVLAMVAQSKCTLQLSDSEGTGLPLIEAAYLGSIPLTRNVGIAPELLSRNSENFIFEKIDDFVSAIIENTKGEFPIESLKLRTKEYVIEIEEEIKLINFTKSAGLLKYQVKEKWISQKISNQISLAKWWMRFYISNRNRVEL